MSKFLGNGGFNPATSPPQRQAGQTNGGSAAPMIAGAPSHPMSIPTVVPASARAAHHSPASISPLGTSPHSPLMSSSAIPIPSSSAAVAARFGQPRALNATGSSPNSGAPAVSQQTMHAIQQQQQLQHVQAASAASIAAPPAAVARHKFAFPNPFANYAPPLLSSSVPTAHAHRSMYFNPVAHITNQNSFLFAPQPLQQQPQQQQQQQPLTAPTVAASSVQLQSSSSSPQSASPASAASAPATIQQPQQPQEQPQPQQPQQQQQHQQQHSPQQPTPVPTQPQPQQQPPQSSPFSHHSQPQQQQSRSLPVSIPAFRRAISFVGLQEGFSLFGPDADTDLTAAASKTKTQPTPPRIQNIGQLGQQLRQHLSGAAASSAAAAAASSASAQSAAASSGPAMQRAASSTAMSDADQSLAPHSMLPEISSPPPTVFSFHDSHDDHLQPQSGHDSPLMLNFDGIHVGTSQPLAAIPQNVPLKQPSPQPQQPGTIFHEPPFARWNPTLSSSAPSHLPSFHQFAHRRDSANSSIASSQAASKHVSSRSSHAQAHRSRQAAHTPTTINSEDNRPSSGQGGTTTEQEWSPPADDDMLDENEVEARLSHTFHGDASECSLSACSSCSGESSDFSVDLEQDFDVTLTFQQLRDDDEDAPTDQAVRQRLNQAKREHHNNRHLHHRRLRIRAQIKQAREDERRGTNGTTGGGDDDWKSHQLHEDEIRVGSYTQGERAGKIQRFLEKRRRRVWSKKILYSCRKNFADKRPRVGGRFVKLKDAAAAEAAAAAAAAGGGDGEEASGEGFGAGAHQPSSGGGSLGGSLSTSPLPLSYGGHGPGLHALTQHMHGALGVPHGGSMTAFSLPLAAYAHTNFSPIVPFGSPNPAASSAAASTPQINELSFLKQEIAPTTTSHMASAPSGLAAALRPHAHAATSPPFFT